MQSETGPEWLTVSEFAKATRAHVNSVRMWIRSGRVKAVQPGRKFLIPATELTRVLSRGKATE